jgi:hypothetical protein
MLSNQEKGPEADVFVVTSESDNRGNFAGLPSLIDDISFLLSATWRHGQHSLLAPSSRSSKCANGFMNGFQIPKGSVKGGTQAPRNDCPSFASEPSFKNQQNARARIVVTTNIRACTLNRISET